MAAGSTVCPSTPGSRWSGASTPLPTDSSASELSEDDNTTESRDVAVVGIACRLAGGNNSPEQLWESILAKRDASSEIPAWRWEPYQYRDSRNPAEIEKTTKRGYYLDAVENFDAAFFGISPKEAEQMDPQQRLSLEVAWEALENAGISPKSLSGSDTAVFMGVNSDDYGKLLLEDLPNVDAWMGIGTAYCGVPNRISYHLNLMGPSTAVDAACASSLVAIHHGYHAILSGQSKVAITGGVNAVCGPGLARALDKAGAVSPDGSCFSFDDDAHGYGRGEGVAVVVLKKMSSAIREGDNIIAVLKAATVAQDGKTNGIMAPNAKAQELVAKQALKQAKVDASTIQYVEAHATSTPLGDPTEVSAIAAIYGHGANRDSPVALGSVKPNVGHLEAGAGAVGFIKAIMAMNKAQYPPQANLNKLNSRIDWEKSGVRVVQEASEWYEPTRHPRRAAICSYGYGGTVSHAIIEQFKSPATFVNGSPRGDFVNVSKGPVLFVLSAPQEKRLASQASSLATWLTSRVGKRESLASVANTLALRRAHHDYRVSFVAESHDQAVEVLHAFATDSGKQEWASQDVKLSGNINKGTVWVFSGHGAQWEEMGKELIRNNPIFCDAIAPLDRITQTENGFSAISALKSGDFIHESHRVQVLTYVVQIGLAAVLRSRGLSPAAVIGHSVGEIAATVTAGSLTPEEGAVIVCRRAKLYESVKGQGGMFLVNLPFEQVKSELSEDGDVAAAIDSSPSSCVVSGSTDAVMAYAETLKSRGIKAIKVATDIAFHSRMLDPLSAPLKEELVNAGIQSRPPKVPLYSTADIDARFSGLRDADYWVKNMVNPVYLTSAVRAAASDGFRLMLEVSSHPILCHSINETLADMGIDDEEFAVLPTMRRNKSAENCLLHAVGSLYVKGADVDLRKHFGRQWSPYVPGTQWAHKPFWRKVQSSPPSSAAKLTHDVSKHTLLGLCNSVGGTDTVLYTTKLNPDTKPFPGSHPLFGTEIVPAAVLLNTFHHATKANTLSDITLRVPIAISSPRDVQVVVHDDTVSIVSCLQSTESEVQNSWATHTTSRWSREKSDTSEPQPRLDIEAAKRRIDAILPSNFSIDYLDRVGVSSMAFPWAVMEHYGNLKEMVVRVDVAPEIANGAALPWDASSWGPLLDAATSVGSTIFFDNPQLRMPAQIEKVHFYLEYGSPPPRTGYLYVETASECKGTAPVHVSLCDDDGRVLVKFESIRFSEIEGTPGVSGNVESLVHRLAWVPAPFADRASEWNKVILISRDEEVLSRYSRQLSLKLRIGLGDISQLRSAVEIADGSIAITPGTAIIYCPEQVSSADVVPAKTESFIADILTLIKFATHEESIVQNVKLFVVTLAVSKASTPTALAHAPLHGLSRTVASEHPEQWGALIDVDEEDAAFPTLALKYVKNQDVVRIDDDLPRVARLQPLPREALLDAKKNASRSLLPKPEGTYLITGGLGALGLKVAVWLVEKGARRIVLLSRRNLPPRREWGTLSEDHGCKAAVVQIQELEKAGVTVHAVSLDIGAPDAHIRLQEKLDMLSLPPVLGVVHAAGILEHQLIRDATADSISHVLSPKISGALALNTVFPVGVLDWFVLFSSCGQLFGFPGQGGYASGNAFLDTLATHRRNQGDNTVAFQWTYWRGLGMAAGTNSVDTGLEGKGITDITAEEGFRAWEHLARYDVDHGVVVRSLAYGEGDPVPASILKDIAPRRLASARAASNSDDGGDGDSNGNGNGHGPSAGTETSSSTPSKGPELKKWLDAKIREILAGVLMLSSGDEVDGRAAIADLGVDSVLTVALRKKLQTVLKVKVPPTLTWSHPTCNHLVGWFFEKLSQD
ncbi:6-methyl salicylic acid synthase [Nemania sp. NC0429]|nr:6-methyl salicylic acid synthase [Nemania sp. NC0429]